MRTWQPERHASAALLLLVAGAASGEAVAAEVTVQVSGLRNASGTIYAAVCTEAEFLNPTCSYFGRAPASAGAVTVSGVPPGTYAVQVVHDENDNQTLDRPGFLPSEGMGFSRDAPMRMGPPRWPDASFALAEPGATVPLTMRYFQ